MSTSGPGGHNFVTPIGNCYYDSVPALFITGQINSQFMRPDPSIRQVGFQETDIVSIVEPVTKYAKMITDPNTIKYEIEKALFIAQDGRPGPVLLDLPLNIQKIDVDPDTMFGFDPENVVRPVNLEVVDRQIDTYLEDLLSAERPVLMVGGGVRISGCVDEMLELGRILGIPAFPTWNALDVISSDYEFYGGRIGTYGGAGRNFGIQNSDLLLAVGSRISGRITGGNIHTFAREAKKYVVDIDESLLQKQLQQVPFDENIFCDAKEFLLRLNAKAQKMKADGKLPDFSAWTHQVMEWKVKYDPVRPEFFEHTNNIHPYAFVRTLSEKMKEGDIVVGDCGGNIVIASHAFETRKGQRFLTNNGNSPMGFSFAGAMGSWFAAPDKQVLCIIGDGGFNMNIQELQTFMNYGVKVKTIILNNHIYGITKAFQETNFEGRAEACGPKGYNPPDFIKIAEAYGMDTMTIKNPGEIGDKIDALLAHDGSIICDVDIHEYHTYEPRIFGWKTPIEDMYPYLPRDEFRANLSIEPLEDWENPAYPDVIQPSDADEPGGP
jgi:acetolactate synthase-1/2/3 large subunit